MATGQSFLGFFRSAYKTQRVQLIAATSGWIGSPLDPDRLFCIVLM